MYPLNTYVIRRATDADEHALRRLAELDSRRPLTGPVLLGEIGAKPAAAISVRDGRVIADPFQSTATVRQQLERRRRAIAADSRTPSLRKRLGAALAPSPRPA
jgi:hypothetical protein